MHSISSTLIWVQNKSVLILQITARKKKCQSNIHSIVSSSSAISFSLNVISFSWMCANYCCSWCFVIFMLFVIICVSVMTKHSLQDVSYVSYMLQIHIRLSFSDLVFKVVLCWYQNSCIVSMLHLNSTTTNVLFCMNVICLLFS